jgi:hypothetical protein
VRATSSSGLPVSLTVVSGPASLSGATLTLTGTGAGTLGATQAGNGTYAPAAPVERPFTVAKGTPALVWNAPLSAQAGTVLGAAQLNASAAPAGGTFAYDPPAGTALAATGPQAISVTYTPAAADAGNYAPVTLTRFLTVIPVVPPPTITRQPDSQAVGEGAMLQLSVTVAGTPPLSYVWRKDGSSLADGGRITGTRSATLSISGVVAADAGRYSLVVDNVAGSVVSNDASVSVLPLGLAATHTLPLGGYMSGGTVVVENTIAYLGTAAGLGWQVLLPIGWSYVSGSGSEAEVKPFASQSGSLEWAWSVLPPSPVVFRIILAVPAGQSGDQAISALAIVRLVGAVNAHQILAKPEPLLVPQATTHTGDSNKNWAFSLFELTRVIELYNTRNGTVRTGRYAVATTATEDGFAPDPVTAPTAPVTLARYHSADTASTAARDAKIDLFELTRVIELYNVRSGTVRTGAYRVLAGTEDGYAPGL